MKEIRPPYTKCLSYSLIRLWFPLIYIAKPGQKIRNLIVSSLHRNTLNHIYYVLGVSVNL